MLYFNHTSEAYHTHFKMIQIDQTMSHETWISLNSNWSLNLHFKCNILHLNGIASHIKAYTSSFNLPSCDCALYLLCYLVVVCRVEVEPEQEAAPFVEDPEPEPRQQGKQTPIDHVDKIPLPSHVSLIHCIG